MSNLPYYDYAAGGVRHSGPIESKLERDKDGALRQVLVKPPVLKSGDSLSCEFRIAADDVRYRRESGLASDSAGLTDMALIDQLLSESCGIPRSFLRGGDLGWSMQERVGQSAWRHSPLDQAWRERIWGEPRTTETKTLYFPEESVYEGLYEATLVDAEYNVTVFSRFTAQDDREARDKAVAMAIESDATSAAQLGECDLIVTRLGHLTKPRRTLSTLE